MIMKVNDYRMVSSYDASHVRAVSARIDADAQDVALLENGHAEVEVVDCAEAPALTVHPEAPHGLE